MSLLHWLLDAHSSNSGIAFKLNLIDYFSYCFATKLGQYFSIIGQHSNVAAISWVNSAYIFGKRLSAKSSYWNCSIGRGIKMLNLVTLTAKMRVCSRATATALLSPLSQLLLPWSSPRCTRSPRRSTSCRARRPQTCTRGPPWTGWCRCRRCTTAGSSRRLQFQEQIAAAANTRFTRAYKRMNQLWIIQYFYFCRMVDEC